MSAVRWTGSVWPLYSTGRASGASLTPPPPGGHPRRHDLGRYHTPVRPADDVQRRPLDLRPQRRHPVLDDGHAVFAVERTHDGGEDADVGHRTRHDERPEAPGPP